MAMFTACSVSRTEQVSRLMPQVVSHSFVMFTFVLRGKGKADNKAPRTESEETDRA